MVRFLVSPTDAGLAGLLNASTSSLPERYGADVLAPTLAGLTAWQRKRFPDDLLDSLRDGRLARELPLLERVPFAVLVVEGVPSYTSEGHLIHPYHTRWTKRQIRNLLRSVWYEHGIRVEWTESIQDTATAIEELAEWMNKGVHKSLLIRPKNEARAEWGCADKKSWARFFLQGFEGIGPDRAEAIYSLFGNRVPLRWDCSREELEEVPGIGKIVGRRLWGSLEQ